MKLALSLCSGTGPKTKTLNKNIPETKFVYVFLKVTPPPQVGTYFGGWPLLLYFMYTELVPNQRSAGAWFWVGTKIPAGSMKLSVLVKKE
jgi:hypothetical protein